MQLRYSPTTADKYTCQQTPKISGKATAALARCNHPQQKGGYLMGAPAAPSTVSRVLLSYTAKVACVMLYAKRRQPCVCVLLLSCPDGLMQQHGHALHSPPYALLRQLHAMPP